MPWDGARRIENERREYFVRQQLHHERFPDYASGWRRPSATTTERVWKLVGEAATAAVRKAAEKKAANKNAAGEVTAKVDADELAAHESAPMEFARAEKQALVVALDAAIQASDDKRLLTHNLIFDAVAGAYSDWYRAARECSPARVSYEMPADTLKCAWRDLGRNEIYLHKLIAAAQNGCGLYTAEKGSDDKYTVELDVETESLRERFLDLIAKDAETGGTYQRRSRRKRLRLAGAPDADDGLADALPDVPSVDDDDLVEDGSDGADGATQKVVAGVAYNVAEPGAESLDVIRALESARLYLNAKNIEAEYDRLVDLADDVAKEAGDKYGVDVWKRGPRVYRSGMSRLHFWRSPWQRHLRDVLGEKPDQTIKKRVTGLAQRFDKYLGQARQLEPIVYQAVAAKKAGKVDRYGELEICTKYEKLSNRRFQALDFWLTEVSGKDKQSAVHDLGPVGDYDDVGGASMLEKVTTTRRGRLFRIGASRSAEERAALARDSESGGPEYGDLLNDRQDPVGVDVSGSQFQIYAVLLGLREFEETLRTTPYKEIAAARIWERHDNPDDPFCLPDNHDFEREDDDRLKEAAKKTSMTFMYGSPPKQIVERLAESVDDFGAGLGTIRNLRSFLDDTVLPFDQIKRWKRACRRIAKRAWDKDPYTGVVFADPLDKTPVRWNPVNWELQPVAGTDGVRIWAKVPRVEKYVMVGKPAVSKKGKPFTRRYRQPFWENVVPNERGEYPTDLRKLGKTFGPCFVHALDSLFCGLVVKELEQRGVSVISVHDGFYVAPDAFRELEAAIKVASKAWFMELGSPGGVYDELERLLGKCTPPKRGKRKGVCCGRCSNWIRELRTKWEDRKKTGDWPEFKVGLVESKSKDAI
jgi:hypothetical protein